MTHITTLYTAHTLRRFDDDGQFTGIFKSPRRGPLHLSRDGLEGDLQGDRRVHGGPDKALHQYPASHYSVLAAHFPAAASALLPGALGENLTVEGMDEQNVCLGDIYAMGTARVQVCQPRKPCWKIDARFAVEGMTVFIAEHGLTGWYYRVLEAGALMPGDAVFLADRPGNAPTLSAFWSLWRAHRPDPAALEAMASSTGLHEGFALKLRERAAWLREESR